MEELPFHSPRTTFPNPPLPRTCRSAGSVLCRSPFSSVTSTARESLGETAQHTDGENARTRRQRPGERYGDGDAPKNTSSSSSSSASWFVSTVILGAFRGTAIGGDDGGRGDFDCTLAALFTLGDGDGEAERRSGARARFIVVGKIGLRH